jgi:hypothetical protein
VLMVCVLRACCVCGLHVHVVCMGMCTGILVFIVATVVGRARCHHVSV